MSAAAHTGRSVTVIDLDDDSPPPVAAGTDVALVVLRSPGRPERRELLAALRDNAEVVMGIVLEPGEHRSGAALAALREFADIVAHAGGDPDIVDDVAATLGAHHSTRAITDSPRPSGAETWQP